MLSAYPKYQAQGATLKGSAWVDLLDPTDAEKSAFQDAFGLRVPVREQLAEIEATSRQMFQAGQSRGDCAGLQAGGAQERLAIALRATVR